MKMFVIHYRKKDWWAKHQSDYKHGVIFQTDVIFANDEDQVFQIFKEEYDNSNLIEIYECNKVYP